MTLSGSAAREAAAKKEVTAPMANVEWNEGVANDTHLAHIDFENFRNEDLAHAYAFSPDDSGTSVNEMSICKSEMLFSSIDDSNEAATGESPGLRDSLLSSNVQQDGNRCYEANKTHYTLAFRDSMANSSCYTQHNNADDGSAIGDRVCQTKLTEPRCINNNEAAISDSVSKVAAGVEAVDREKTSLPSSAVMATTSPKSKSDSSSKRVSRHQYPSLDFLGGSSNVNEEEFYHQVLNAKRQSGKDNEDFVVASSCNQSLLDVDSLVKLLPPNLNLQVKRSGESKVVKEAWPPNNANRSSKPPFMPNEKRTVVEGTEGRSSSVPRRPNANSSSGSQSVTQVKIRRSRRRSNFPKSGSQNNLCDRMLGGKEDRGSPVQHSESHIGVSAEYPLSATGSNNTSMRSKQGHVTEFSDKRALFMRVYRATERLVTHQEDAHLSRLVFTADFVPALYDIMSDGLKSELITSFGPMKSSVWRVIEAIAQRGDVADLVMVINDKKFKIKYHTDREQELRKLSAFVVGLLNMSCLHVWFSRLRWSIDILLRFYERNAFLCAQTRDTKLLLDELVFCLQRLFALPLLGQSSPDVLTVSELDYYFDINSSRRISASPGAEYNKPSRIPRPVSLPKRLEYTRFGSLSVDRSDNHYPSVRPSGSRSKSRPRVTKSNVVSKSTETQTTKSDTTPYPSCRQSNVFGGASGASRVNSRRPSLHRNTRGGQGQQPR